MSKYHSKTLIFCSLVAKYIWKLLVSTKNYLQKYFTFAFLSSILLSYIYKFCHFEFVELCFFFLHEFRPYIWWLLSSFTDKVFIICSTRNSTRVCLWIRSGYVVHRNNHLYPVSLEDISMEQVVISLFSNNQHSLTVSTRTKSIIFFALFLMIWRMKVQELFKSKN